MPTDDKDTPFPQDEPDTTLPPRTVALSDLTPEQRNVVLALFRAAEAAEARKLADQQAHDTPSSTEQ